MSNIGQPDYSFVGPPAPSSQDWLLPVYLQPGYGSEYISGGFPADTFTPTWIEPEPASSWLTSLTKPFANFGASLVGAAGKTIAATYEKVPELLWNKYVNPIKTVKVDEGAGVTTTYTQPANAGGEPAKPISISIPPMYGFGAGSAPKAGDVNTALLIGAALVVAFLVFGRK